MSSSARSFAKLVLIAASTAGITACDDTSNDEIAPETAELSARANEAAEAKADPAMKPVDEAAPENGAEAETPTARVGQPAPDFALTDEAGSSHKLSDYRGKFVVLEWFCPTCPFVKRHYETGNMVSTAKAVTGDDVAWLAIDSSHFVLPAASKTFRNKNEVPYPILQDPTGRVGRLYAAKTTPHMFVIDKEGVLRYAGAIDDDPRGEKKDATNYVKLAIEELKAGKPVGIPTTTPYGCTVKYGES